MRLAWTVYEPVGLPGEPSPLTMPAEEEILAAYRREVLRYTKREIQPLVARLEDSLRRGGDEAGLRNHLGVVYARFGQLDKAEEQFRQVLSVSEAVPALVNLGNVAFLRQEWETALGFYRRAEARAPENPRVLLPIARVNHKLEDYASARVVYEQLRVADARLAARFSYLGQESTEGVRAAESAQLEAVVLWDEE